MVVSAIDDSLQIINPSSPFGIVLLVLQWPIFLADIACIFWLTVKRPYRRHGTIEWMIIFICSLNIIFIIFGYLNSFTVGTRVVDIIGDWSGDLLIISMYILELEILLIFEPLSSAITKLRINLMQGFIVLLHFASYGPGYYCFVLLVSGVTVMPDWLVSWYTAIYSMGLAVIVICNLAQSAFVTRLLYIFITRRKNNADLSEEEKLQIQFSRSLVKRYLIWILIIALFDFMSIGFNYFGSFELSYITNLFLSGRVLELIATFSFVIQIPFKAAPYLPTPDPPTNIEMSVETPKSSAKLDESSPSLDQGGTEGKPAPQATGSKGSEPQNGDTIKILSPTHTINGTS